MHGVEYYKILTYHIKSIKIIQCVHKIPPGFRVSAVLKQIELDSSTLLWLVVKLSKFIHSSTDDVNVDCCILSLVVNKMATVQERASCVDRIAT